MAQPAKPTEQQVAEGEFVSERMGMMISAIQGDQQKEILEEFGKNKTDEDRFSHVWKIHMVHEVIQLEPEYHEKSSSEAAKHREKGNKFFQKKSYLSALQSYNESVIQAPVFTEHQAGENHLALSYGNRSAALLHQQRYYDALDDIDLAFESHYPTDSQYKLFDRQGKCYIALKDKSNAALSFNRALENVQKSGLNEQVLEKWKQNIDSQIKACDKIPDGKVKEKASRGPKIPQLGSSAANEKYPALSKVLQVQNNKSQGRYLETAGTARVGEVVAVDSPYCSVLFQEFHQTHCNHCMISTTKPVPCRQCVSVVYCSRECRDAAWNSYHKFECQYYALFDKLLCAKIGHIAVRMAMKAGLSFLLDYIRNEKKRVKSADGSLEDDPTFNKDGVYTGDYNSIYHMETHGHDRFDTDVFDYAVIACFLTKILLLSGFFKQDNEDLSSTENVQMIGSVLLHHLQIIQCNANRIQELKESCRFDQPQSNFLGVAIYPTAALCNHSCDPNADFNYYGNKVVLRAVRNIYDGDEVCVSYGPVYYDAKRKIRQHQLRQCYFFSCQCEACEGYWPTVDRLEDCIITFRCEACRQTLDLSNNPHKKIATCPRCKHKQNMEEVVGRLQLSHDAFAKGMSDAFSGKYEEALANFQDHLVTMQQYVCQPWRDFTSCQVSIKHCYRLLENK